MGNSQRIQLLLCQILGGRTIYFLEVSHERFLIFASYVFGAIADLMDQAVLYFYFRKNAFDSLGKTIEIVDTNYEHVGHTSIAQIGKHTEPEVCPLAFRNVHTQKIFTPFSIDAQDVVHGPGRDSPFIFLQFCAGANILFLAIVARSLSLAAPRASLNVIEKMRAIELDVAHGYAISNGGFVN